MPKQKSEPQGVLVAMAPPVAETPKLVHSIDSAALILDVCPRTVRNLIARGKLEAIKVESSSKVLDTSIRKLVAEAPRVTYAA